MTAAAIPFIASGYILGASLIVSGIRQREAATCLAGILVVVCLTLALTS